MNVIAGGTNLLSKPLRTDLYSSHFSSRIHILWIWIHLKIQDVKVGICRATFDTIILELGRHIVKSVKKGYIYMFCHVK